MGFRNPITSADAVDTGQPAGAGVRIYQAETAYGTTGIIELRDGIVGDTPSTISSSANLVPQGGGYTAQGGGLSVGAGSWNGVSGPQLGLSVVADPGGGYMAEARLRNAGLIIEQPGTRIQGRKPLLGVCGLFSDPTNAAGDLVVNHGLGTMPTAFLMVPYGGTSVAAGAIPFLVDFIVTGWNSATANARAMRRDNNTAFGGNTVAGVWIALLPAP
jgi:hypothetical protein